MSEDEKCLGAGLSAPRAVFILYTPLLYLPLGVILFLFLFLVMTDEMRKIEASLDYDVTTGDVSVCLQPCSSIAAQTWLSI